MTQAEKIDIAWVLVCAALVVFMQAGFTALESGLVRSKNSIHVAIKNFASFMISVSLFWAFGFALMFGAGDGLVGTSSFFLDSDRPYVLAFFVFQVGFIGTAVTLISGSVAERMRFGGSKPFWLELAVPRERAEAGSRAAAVRASRAE